MKSSRKILQYLGGSFALPLTEAHTTELTMAVGVLRLEQAFYSA